MTLKWGERLVGEKLPVSKTIKIIERIDLYKTAKWWAAVVLQDYFGRRQLAVYLWVKKGDQWKRKQKFVVHNEDEWMRIRESVEKLLHKLRKT